MGNITIITDKNFSDYHLGFEVQSPQKEFISWDMTYDEVLALPYVKPVIDTGSESDYYCFEYPVRMGSFLFPRLEFRCDNKNRSDAAVGQYISSTINLSENNKLYEKIKVKLLEDLAPEQKNSDFERGFFYYEGILFTIFFCEDDDHLAFFMTNVRDYPDLRFVDRYSMKAK